MQVFDASSMIQAWDNYPMSQFPGLWDWLEIEIKAERLMMPEVAFDEVDQKAPDCGTWLKNSQLKQLPANTSILQEALRFATLLGISQGKYGKGVGENDLIIIATAKEYGAELVSDEKRQDTLPFARKG